MNEFDLDRDVVEDANGLTRVNIMNINIPCDVGSTYCCFTPPPTHITLNFRISNLSTINHKIGAILRNATHNFRQKVHFKLQQ